MSSPDAILYRFPPKWGLSSMSPACIQVETYLRLANITYATQDCQTSSASPNGKLPSVELKRDDGSSSSFESSHMHPTEFSIAKDVITTLKETKDLDADLNSKQKSELIAYTALVETQILPAIIYSIWCENEAYSNHTSKAYGSGLPFPINWIIPVAKKREIMKQFGGGGGGRHATTANTVYGKAADALTALAARIQSTSTTQGYFFGSTPSSLDAVLYSCLLFLSTAPVVHPVLKDKVKEWSCFHSYIARISKEKFSSPVPAASSISGDAWSEWDGSGGCDTPAGRARAKERRERRTGGGGGGGGGGSETEAEAAMHRKGRWWLAGAAATIVAYVIFGAGYFEIGYLVDEDEEEDVNLD